MPLSFIEQKRILRKKNSSELTPVKLHSEEVTNENLVIVIKPRFKNSLAVKYILPQLKNKFFKIKLDKFGSFIWLNMDGSNTIKDIINRSKKEFGEEIQPADERINKFLLQLFENKLVSFKEVNY